MKKILSTIILFVTLTGCSATMNEWQVGAKHPGYKAKDVCWICGEQIKFFPNEDRRSIVFQTVKRIFYKNGERVKRKL